MACVPTPLGALRRRSAPPPGSEEPGDTASLRVGAPVEAPRPDLRAAAELRRAPWRHLSPCSVPLKARGQASAPPRGPEGPSDETSIQLRASIGHSDELPILLPGSEKPGHRTLIRGRVAQGTVASSDIIEAPKSPSRGHLLRLRPDESLDKLLLTPGLRRVLL